MAVGRSCEPSRMNRFRQAVIGLENITGLEGRRRRREHFTRRHGEHGGVHFLGCPGGDGGRGETSPECDALPCSPSPPWQPKQRESPCSPRLRVKCFLRLLRPLRHLTGVTLNRIENLCPASRSSVALGSAGNSNDSTSSGFGRSMAMLLPPLTSRADAVERARREIDN